MQQYQGIRGGSSGSKYRRRCKSEIDGWLPVDNLLLFWLHSFDARHTVRTERSNATPAPREYVPSGAIRPTRVALAVAATLNFGDSNSHGGAASGVAP